MQEFTDIHTKGIVIGHDARHGSYRYGFIAKYVKASAKSGKNQRNAFCLKILGKNQGILVLETIKEISRKLSYLCFFNTSIS